MLEPTKEKFESLRKDDLIALSKHLVIVSEIKSSMRKCKIQKVIMEHLAQKETFQQSALEKYQNTQIQSPTTISNSQVNLTDKNGSDKLDRERRQWQKRKKRDNDRENKKRDSGKENEKERRESLD